MSALKNIRVFQLLNYCLGDANQKIHSYHLIIYCISVAWILSNKCSVFVCKLIAIMHKEFVCGFTQGGPSLWFLHTILLGCRTGKCHSHDLNTFTTTTNKKKTSPGSFTSATRDWSTTLGETGMASFKGPGVGWKSFTYTWILKNAEPCEGHTLHRGHTYHKIHFSHKPPSWADRNPWSKKALPSKCKSLVSKWMPGNLWQEWKQVRKATDGKGWAHLKSRCQRRPTGPGIPGSLISNYIHCIHPHNL